MTVEEAICARVASLTPVIAIVGQRVYLDKTPQDPTYPLVLVYLVDDFEAQHLRGPEGIAYARVTVEGRAHEESGVDTYQVADLWAAFNGDGRGSAASGVFGWIGTVDNIAIQNCAHRSPRLRFYDAAEQRVLRMTQDYWVTYKAA